MSRRVKYFSPSLDELVEEDNNVVRAIEAYVDTLDIFKLNIKTKRSKNNLIMKNTIKKDIAKIDEDIKNYMTILETLDKEDANTTNLKISKEEIEKLLIKKEQFQKDLDMLNALGKEQYNKTDKDATIMSKPAHIVLKDYSTL